MSAFKDLEHSGWTTAVDRYDAAFQRLTSQSIPTLLEAVGAGPGVRLLDVACGPGYVGGAAARLGAQVVAVDFSATMVALARQRFPSIEVHEGDAEALDFPDASFDAVTINFGVLHLDRPEAALAESARVLRRGGRLAFTVWAPPEQTVGFGIVLGAVARCGNPNVPLPAGPPFFQFSDAAFATRALEAAGFAQARVTTVPMTWHFSRAGELFDALLEGTVRTSALLKAQTSPALAAIREAIAADVQRFAVDDGFALPMPCVLVSGIKA